MKNSMPEYKSKTYYNVVIRAGSFRHWRCNYAGEGSMQFFHPKEGSIKISKGMSENWMQECWDDFMLFLSAKNGSAEKTMKKTKQKKMGSCKNCLKRHTPRCKEGDCGDNGWCAAHKGAK